MLLQHTVTVERFLGEGAYGPTYEAAETLSCFVDETTRLVRSPEGNEVTSTVTVYLPDTVEQIPSGSRVTTARRETTVIDVKYRDGGTLPVPSHVEVVCQ